MTIVRFVAQGKECHPFQRFVNCKSVELNQSRTYRIQSLFEPVAVCQ